MSSARYSHNGSIDYRLIAAHHASVLMEESIEEALLVLRDIEGDEVWIARRLLDNALRLSGVATDISGERK